MIMKTKSVSIRNLLIYIFTGFFVIFALSLAFPQDICGSEEVASSPRIFFAFGTVLLFLFYFINQAIKQTWLFLLIVAIFSALFEYLLIGLALGITNFTEWETYLGMAVYWVVWFGVLRYLYQWLIKRK